MDVTAFAAMLRASHQLSADNQAAIDWADDTEFRLTVARREPMDAVKTLFRRYDNGLESRLAPRKKKPREG
jgi:hypothetical protein